MMRRSWSRTAVLGVVLLCACGMQRTGAVQAGYVPAAVCGSAASSPLDPVSAYFAALDRAQSAAFSGSATCLDALTTGSARRAIGQWLAMERARHPGTVLRVSTAVQDAELVRQGQQDYTCATVRVHVLVRAVFAPHDARRTGLSHASPRAVRRPHGRAAGAGGRHGRLRR